MGAIWGLAAVTALENNPVKARGLASGFSQEGYIVGYLIVAVNNLFVMPKVKRGWRALFSKFIDVCSGVKGVVAGEVFLRAKATEVENGHMTTIRRQRCSTGEKLMKCWLLCIYAVLLMTSFFLRVV